MVPPWSPLVPGTLRPGVILNPYLEGEIGERVPQAGSHVYNKQYPLIQSFRFSSTDDVGTLQETEG